MKIGALLGDVVRSLFKNTATQNYPAKRTPNPERLRGKLVWTQENCIGCGLCAKDCPAFALEFTVLDKKEKRFVMEYDVNRCIYCMQCVVSCRFNALALSNEEWELAALTQDPFRVFYGKDEDVAEVLAKEAKKFADPNFVE